MIVGEITGMPSSPARSPQCAPQGQAAIIIALALTVLACATALGVDGARFYAEGLRVQRAADQAALVGVSQASMLGADQGRISATDIVTRNLAVSGDAAVSVNTTYAITAFGQEKVVVQEKNFPFLFAPVVGLTSGTITREATARYTAPLPMGNPTSQLGDTGTSDPGNSINTYQPGGGATAPTRQGLKLSINFPDTHLESGDPYSPLYVLSDPPFFTYPGAPVYQNPFRPSTGFNGYDYKVDVHPAPGGGTTYIQVYDAEQCNGDTYGDGVATITSNGLPYSGNTDPQSTGTHYSSPYQRFPTYYRIYHLAANGQQQSFNPIGTDPTLRARGPLALSTSPPMLPPDTVIAPPAGLSNASDNVCDLSPYKDQWYTLAQVKTPDATLTPTPPNDSYKINVSTCLAQHPYAPNASDPGPNDRDIDTSHTYHDPSQPGIGLTNCYGGGANNFALRAVTTTKPCVAPSSTALDCQTFDTSDTSNVQPSVSGMGRISVKVDNSTAGKTLLYLARIDPMYAGKYLLIKLFDPGDGKGAASMQIVRPDGGYADLSWFTQTLKGDGTVLSTPVINIAGNKSIITSFPANRAHPDYTTPLLDPATPLPHTPLCPSQTTQQLQDQFGYNNITPPGAPAFGQTMAELNPFDPIHSNPSYLGCVGALDNESWDGLGGQLNRPPTPGWISSTIPDNSYQSYNLMPPDSAHPNPNYVPFNGRWLYIFTQIPSDYGTPGTHYYAPSLNPNPGWWYVQYLTPDGGQTDRTTWEATIINTPPHLSN